MNKEITTFLAVEAFIQERTRKIRDENVLTEDDIACLYESNIAEVHIIIARNKKRFPSDFMFRLDEKEKQELSLTRKTVYAFTWGGILMLGAKLKSSRAIKTNIQMIELFVGKMQGKVFELLSEIQNQEK